MPTFVKSTKDDTACTLPYPLTHTHTKCQRFTEEESSFKSPYNISWFCVKCAPLTTTHEIKTDRDWTIFLSSFPKMEFFFARFPGKERKKGERTIKNFFFGGILYIYGVCPYVWERRGGGEDPTEIPMFRSWKNLYFSSFRIDPYDAVC